MICSESKSHAQLLRINVLDMLEPSVTPIKTVFTEIFFLLVLTFETFKK